MFSSTIRRSLAIAGLSGAALAAAAVPAFATVPGPSTSAQATVTVNQAISFAFIGSPSFALNPGQVSHSAVSFNIQTNDNKGYTLTMSAPDLSDGAGTIPATDLTYTSFNGGAQVGGTANQLTNAAAVALNTTIAPSAAGDTYTQDWLASIPSNQSPGAYQTTLTYTVTGN